MLSNDIYFKKLLQGEKEVTEFEYIFIYYLKFGTNPEVRDLASECLDRLRFLKREKERGVYNG